MHNYSNGELYYIILIVDNNGLCYDTTIKSIHVLGSSNLYLPNAFTPNGDRKNDKFFPEDLGIDPEHFEMWILDRWGNLIWQTKTWGQAWDG